MAIKPSCQYLKWPEISFSCLSGSQPHNHLFISAKNSFCGSYLKAYCLFKSTLLSAQPQVAVSY